MGGVGVSGSASSQIAQLLQEQQLAQIRAAMYSTLTSTPGGAGVMSQNFGRLAMNAGLGQAMNVLSGGLLVPQYAYSWGLSRGQVMEDASQEMKQRFARDIKSEFISGLIPHELLRRTSWAFAGDRPEIARNALAALSGLRGADITAVGGRGRVGGIGMQLGSDAVHQIALSDERALLGLNKRLGYALGSDDVRSLTGIMNRYQVSDAFRAAGPGGDVVGAMAQGRAGLAESIHKLARALQLNVEQTEKLVKQGEQHGVLANSRTFQALGRIGIAESRLQMSYEERAKYALPIAAQAATLGMDRVTAANRVLGFAENLVGAYRSNWTAGEGEMARFGGATLDEQALRQAQYKDQLGVEFAKRHAPSFGALHMTGWGGGSALQLGVELGDQLAKDPTLGIRARVDGSTRSWSAAAAALDAFAYVEDTRRLVGVLSNKEGGDAAASIQYGRLIGEQDPVMAHQSYMTFEREITSYMAQGLTRDEAMRKLRIRSLSGAGSDTGLAAIMKALGDRKATPLNVDLAKEMAASGWPFTPAIGLPAWGGEDRAGVLAARGAASAILPAKALRDQLGANINDPHLLRMISAISSLDGKGVSVDELSEQLASSSMVSTVPGFTYSERAVLDNYLNREINKEPAAHRDGTTKDRAYYVMPVRGL